jgi:hypothetical protein
MGNKKRKILKKAAAAKLRKTGGIPPVTLAVADPVLAFTQSIPADSSAGITIQKALERIVEDVAKNRPQKGPLKKVKLSPKKVILDRITLRKDEDGKLIMDILPGDPIAYLNGKPFVRKKKDIEANGEVGQGGKVLNTMPVL